MIRCFSTATAEPDLQDWRLDIYGEGDQREHLSQAITDSGNSPTEYGWRDTPTALKKCLRTLRCC